MALRAFFEAPQQRCASCRCSLSATFAYAHALRLYVVTCTSQYCLARGAQLAKGSS